jgi:hypothetical protein
MSFRFAWVTSSGSAQRQRRFARHCPMRQRTNERPNDVFAVDAWSVDEYDAAS